MRTQIRPEPSRYHMVPKDLAVMYNSVLIGYLNRRPERTFPGADGETRSKPDRSMQIRHEMHRMILRFLLPET